MSMKVFVTMLHIYKFGSAWLMYLNQHGGGFTNDNFNCIFQKDFNMFSLIGRGGYFIKAGWCIYASSNSAIIGSDNVLSHGRYQVIIWTNDALLWTRHLLTCISEIWIKIW